MFLDRVIYNVKDARYMGRIQHTQKEEKEEERIEDGLCRKEATK